MIGNFLIHLISYSLPIGLVGVMWQLNSRRWTRLAKAYRAVDEADCSAKRTMQTVILVAGDIGWNSYKGIVTVGVTRKGILLKLMPPFSIFHPTLLIPYAESDIEPRRWYLVGKTYQYTLSRLSDVKLIVHDDLQDWIETQVASLAITQASPDIGNDSIASIQAAR